MKACKRCRTVVILMSGLIALIHLLPSNSSVTAHARQSSVRQPTQSKTQPEGDDRVVKVIWQEPFDLESRDLFYGIGGKKGEPDLSDTFRFVGKVTSGHAEKIRVEDSRNRRWTVKFGEEPRPETAASRIVWAVGYHTD